MLNFPGLCDLRRNRIGNIFVGGHFDCVNVNGRQTRNFMARLEASGLVDQTLDNLHLVGSVPLRDCYPVGRQILIGGDFTTVQAWTGIISRVSMLMAPSHIFF